MLTDGQTEELVRLAETQSAKALVAYVQTLLAQARADERERIAVYFSTMSIADLFSGPYIAKAIRARKDAP